MGALIGLGMPELQNRDAIPDWVKLQYAGLLTGAPRNADGLQAMLSDHFACSTRIEEFVGGWMDLPEDGRWRLGWSRDVSTLGRTTVLGRRMWRCERKFRIVMGPLDGEEFRSLLPGGMRLERLTALVRSYVGDEFDFDVRLMLAEDATRQVRLGRGDRLGLTTRLGTKSRTTRRDDVVVHPTTQQTRRSRRRVS
jgi:type VI secretion system protein ImpH